MDDKSIRSVLIFLTGWTTETDTFGALGKPYLFFLRFCQKLNMTVFCKNPSKI